LVLGARNGQTRYYRNNGLGVFTDVTATHFVLRTDTTEDITAGDVDGDNDVDLVLANYTGQPRLYLNDGTGKFVDATSQLPAGALSCGAVVLANVDGDNDLDLVLGM